MLSNAQADTSQDSPLAGCGQPEEAGTAGKERSPVQKKR